MLSINPNTDYPTKLSFFISSLITSDLIKVMKSEEIDETVLLLLQSANLQTETITTYREGVTPIKFTDSSFCVAESLINRKLFKSLGYYFEKTKGYPLEPKTRSIIVAGLLKFTASSEIKNDDYQTLAVILENIPSLNISTGGVSLISNILNLNLNNQKLAHLLHICTEMPNFDYFYQNQDGSYFYEKYINNLINTTSHSKSKDERVAFVGELLHVDKIKYELLTYIKSLPENHRVDFEKIILAVELDSNLGHKPDERQIKI